MLRADFNMFGPDLVRAHFDEPFVTRNVGFVYLNIAVFHESGTDRKAATSTFDRCHSRQKRRRVGWLNGEKQTPETCKKNM